MKKDELNKLREKDAKDLEIEMTKLKKELAEKKLAIGAGKLKNVQEVRKLRRDLAQLLTILAMKQFVAEQIENKT